MANDILLEIGATAAPLQRELARAQSLARDFQAQVARATATLPEPRINRAAFVAEGTQAGALYADAIRMRVAGADPFTGLTRQAQRAVAAIGTLRLPPLVVPPPDTSALGTLARQVAALPAVRVARPIVPPPVLPTVPPLVVRAVVGRVAPPTLPTLPTLTLRAAVGPITLPSLPTLPVLPARVAFAPIRVPDLPRVPPITVPAAVATGALEGIVARFRAAGGESGLAFASQLAAAARSGGSVTALAGLIPQALAGGAAAGVAAAAGIAGIAVAAGAAYVAVGRLGDAQQLLAARIRLVADNATEAATIQTSLLQIANATGTPLDAAARGYTRIASAAREFGASQQEALVVSRAVTQALALGGASAQEAASASMQLSQALGSGQLSGEELRAVLEASRPLAEAIAAGFGTSVGRLKAMGAAGELVSSKVFAALVRQSGELQAKFDQLPPTMERAGQALENSLGVAIGRIDDAVGASRNLARLLNFVAGTINDVSGASSAARQAQVAALAPIEKARFLTSERLNLARQIAQVDAGGLKAPQVRALQDEIRLRRDNIRVLEATGALEALRAARVLPAVTVTGLNRTQLRQQETEARAAARAVVAAFDNEMQGILRTAGQIELGGLVVPGFESAAVTAFDRVTSALVRQQDQTSEAAAKLRDYRRELLNIPAVELLRGTGAALAARLQVTVTPSVTVNPVITAANIDLREIIRAPNLDGFQRAATAASNGLGAVRSAAEAARAGLGDTRGALANFADALDTAARAAGALEQLADVARRPGAVIGRTASGGVDAFATITNVASIVGAVSSLASLVGGLLNDPIAAAAAAATRANTDELARVRSELSGFGRSLGSLGQAERIARDVIAQSAAIRAAQRIIPGGVVTAGQGQIEAQLRAAGLSLADLDRVARDYNITLLQNGRLLASGLGQLAERLDLARTAALRWADGFAGQVDRLDFAARVRDLDTSGVEAAQRTLNESAAIFGRLTSEAPQLYARLFAGLDVNTAGGREALNARLNTLVEDLLSDEFTAGRGALYEAIRNSGFANLEEFRGFILRTDDALDEFATATRAATNALGSLGSVPEVFKRNLAALQFQYQAPYMPPPRPAPAPTPTPAPYRPDGYTPARPVVVEEHHHHYGPGAVVVPGAIPDAKTLIEHLDKEIKQQSRAIGGSLSRGQSGLVWALNA